MKVERIKIQWQQVELDSVIDYYVKGFGVEISNYEFYIDPVKKKVIFKLYIEGKEGIE
jgi:hypothetical protein